MRKRTNLKAWGLISVVLVLSLVTNVLASEIITWDNNDGTGDRLWDTATNWDLGRVPDQIGDWDWVIIDYWADADNGPIVNADQNAVCMWLDMGAFNVPADEAVLTMTSGSLKIGDWMAMGYYQAGYYRFDLSGGTVDLGANGFTVGYVSGSYVTFNMSGGTINSGTLSVGTANTGQADVNMTGGIVNIDSWLTIGSYTELHGKGHVDLHGGTIEAQSLSMGGGGVGTIDVTDGVLIIDIDLTVSNGWMFNPGVDTPSGSGDYTGTLPILIEKGLITAFDVNSGEIITDDFNYPTEAGLRAVVKVDYDVTNPGKTTLSAAAVDPNLAWNPSPPSGASGLIPPVTLSWTPGDNTASHEVYFGTSFADVNDANTASDPNIYRGSQLLADVNYPIPETLAWNTAYFWRIDEVNNPTWKGNVWSFTIETGQAKHPSPEDEATDVDSNVLLSWTQGIDAASHNLYFGTDSNEVNGTTPLVGDVDGSGQVDWSDISVLAQQWLGQPPGGSQPSADWNDDGTVNIFDFTIVASNWKASGNGVFKGHYALDANCYDACGLELGKTYYWQIDEVNAPRMWPGDVWSFRVAEYPTFRAFSGVCRHTRDPLRSLYDNALGWGRQDIPWIELEPYAPNDPNYVWMQWNLDSYGDLVLAYKAKYAHLLPILDYGTDWAGGYRFIDDEHVVNWQNYVERVVDFLRRPPYNVKFFQIWNEPDYSVFWHGDMDTFMMNVHLPGADVIHNLGCKVVFGGWLGNPSGLVDLLDLHSAWDSVDVLDMHYKGIGDWQYLRDAAAARGYENIPIWETEVGGTWHSTPDLHYISNFYPRLFYWALTHNANMSADMYKVFYYREWEDGNPAGDGYHQCLYSGNDLWHLGASLQTLGDLFDGGIVSDYNAVGNNRGLTAQQITSVSSIESFEMDDWVVTAIHLDDSDVGNPSTDTVILTYSDFQDANDVNSVERVDVSGYITDLSGSYDVNGLTVTVPVANDSGSPVQNWGLDGSVYNFYVVVTRDE